MGRYRGPVVKLCRREGVNLIETPKVQRYMEAHPYPPGQHGQRRRRKPSDYGVRLREKQKLRFYYNMSERQFHNLFEEANRAEGSTGTVFLQLLESRLDNVVYRLGIAYTRRQARQFVAHGHILVNGKRVDVPSYRVSKGEVISVREKSKSLTAIAAAKPIADNFQTSFLDVNRDALTANVTALPDETAVLFPLRVQLVVEYYSQRL